MADKTLAAISATSTSMATVEMGEGGTRTLPMGVPRNPLSPLIHLLFI